MDTSGDSVSSGAVGGDGPARRPRTVALVVLATMLTATLLGTAAGPAVAATTSAAGGATTGSAADTTASTGAAPGDGSLVVDPAPSGTPTGPVYTDPRPTGTPSPPPSGDPAPNPTIADPGDVTSSTAAFHGRAMPGHRVRVMDPSVTSRSVCTARADRSGAWSCHGPVSSGPQQVFTVQDVDGPTTQTTDAPAADVITPPVVTTTGTTAGSVVGTGYPGATVTVTASGSGAVRTATVGADGRWTVSWASGPAPRPTGAVVLTATQTGTTAAGFRSELRSAASSPVTVTVDRTPPAAPRITAPSPGDRVRALPVVVRGTGEAGATVTVYVDHDPVCRTTVGADGSWSCSTGGSALGVGTHSLLASQHDPAGNFSPTSTAVGVRVAVGTAGPTAGGPDGSGTASTTPGRGSATPGPGAAVDGDPTDGGSASGGGAGDGAPTAGAGAGAGDSGDGPGATSRSWSGPAGDWTVATGYDRAVPTIQSAFSWRTLCTATAVAAGFLLLVVGPVLLAGRWNRGRPPTRPAFLGRNRPRGERSRGDDALPTWASVTTAVGLAAVLMLLGVGVSFEARFVRLAIGVLLGCLVLAATTVLATRWAAGRDRHAVGYRVSPWLVAAALGACVVTRVADLSPALAVGVLLVPVGRTDVDTGVVRLGRDIAANAKNATWRSVTLLAVAAAGWAVHSLVIVTGAGSAGGFWTSLVSEFAITVCLGGLGSFVLTMLPLARSAGGALWAASRVRYVAIAVVGTALAAAVTTHPAGPDAAAAGTATVGLAVVAAGCLLVMAGAWVRYRLTGPRSRA